MGEFSFCAFFKNHQLNSERFFRTIDQFANLVLHETLERIHVDKYYGDIQRGVFLIRGENVVLAGEIDETKEQSSGSLN